MRDFSLTIQQGELVTLLGPSGCGKTTTLNLLAGFTHPDRGAIIVDGRQIEWLPPHKRNTALVFQGYALFPHLTVARNIAFGLEIRKVAPDEIRRRTGEMLELVQLANMADRYPRQLSGGQQQRVAIARALAVNPSVLLLDEPLSNLDAKLREEMRSEIRSVQRKTGITAMYVTHDQEEALSISDRVVVMNGGLIEQVATPQEIYRAPASPFVANFIGGANLIPVTVRAIEPDHVVAASDDGFEFVVAGPSPTAVGKPAFVMVRPEQITVSARHEPPNSYPVALDDHAFLGAVSFLALRLGDRPLRVRSQSGEAIALAGKGQIYARWAPEQALLIPDRTQ
ncbi:ABC transporter ATP-binding protein [Bosea sp. (in: a-proteobacteria)]|uniref:ABC transporter ATP-binding protein n=1 Tax=Bosea sp. (in: a-proteobacteria) TaxID=1871050 RepID=UPI002639C76A|nr:ABC transporter ATP-binding protein [Bosea sp. (in: a-proteobacteria)]MCO5089576.1 ABC transporter ATP-binding protein [Bosea sp. (in: a-proteobacteria)]